MKPVCTELAFVLLVGRLSLFLKSLTFYQNAFCPRSDVTQLRRNTNYKLIAMAGGLGLVVSNFIRQKRAALTLIFVTTVVAIVIVANAGGDPKGKGGARRSFAALVNWAQLGHQEDDAESRGDSHQETDQDSAPAFGVHPEPSSPGKVPHYLSPEERLKRISATFRDRNLGDENLCPAIKKGEIDVDRHKRRGGKKSAWIATWKGKKVVVKRNDFEVSVALNKNLFYAWDRNDDGRVERVEFFKSLANALERMGK